MVSQKRKGRNGTSVPDLVTKTGRAEENNVRLDESCDFKVVSEGDAAARRRKINIEKDA
jgi:hypothetical protein